VVFFARKDDDRQAITAKFGDSPRQLLSAPDFDPLVFAVYLEKFQAAANERFLSASKGMIVGAFSDFSCEPLTDPLLVFFFTELSFLGDFLEGGAVGGPVIVGCRALAKGVIDRVKNLGLDASG
jgi:hypothetical protein